MLKLVCRELVDRVAVNGTVIVTWANSHYLDFVMNWVHHLHLLGLGCYLVGAMDDSLLQVRFRTRPCDRR